MLNPKHSYKAYSKTDVNTSDQLTLIIMLYDGLLRFLKKAMVKICLLYTSDAADE